MTFTREALLKSPLISYWLKNAIRELDNRDVVDALRDVKILEDLLNQKFKRLQEIVKA